MLGVNHAYVTTIGRWENLLRIKAAHSIPLLYEFLKYQHWFRLIGVVGLKELRKAIEDANSGQVTRTHMHQIRAEEVLACFLCWPFPALGTCLWSSYNLNCSSQSPFFRRQKHQCQGISSLPTTQEREKERVARQMSMDRWIICHCWKNFILHCLAGRARILDSCIDGLSIISFSCLRGFR